MQAIYSDVDDTPIVRPYYNSANPATGLSGPMGSGAADNTFRRGKCTISIKAGSPASSGSQVTPSPDPGNVGLYSITVANGQTTITSGNIAAIPTVPFFPTLPSIPAISQSGSWTYGVDSGTTNNYAVTLTPPPTSIAAGMNIRVKMLSAPLGASVINVNQTGNNPIIKKGGAALTGYEWAPNDIVSLNFDGTSWQVLNIVQPILTAAATYYVATTGSDSNNGLTSGTPFLTIQHAINIISKINLNGYPVTIQVADGTYTGNAVASGQFFGGGSVTISGNPTTPANCIIHVTSNNCILATSGAALNVSGLSLLSDDVLNSALSATHGGIVTITGLMIFGSCSGGHIVANDGGQVIVSHSYTINGGAFVHWSAGDQAVILCNYPITLSGTPNFSGQFVSATINAVIIAQGASFIGSATGVRYVALLNSTIITSGGGASFFPGSSAGSANTGGQYT